MTGIFGIPTAQTPIALGATDDPNTPAGGYPPSGGGGQTPQPPPTQQAPPQGGGTPPATLGDVNAMMPADRPELDIGARFKTYLDLMRQASADSYREHLPEESKPGLLAQILTFGQAGAMDQAYRTAYNSAIDRHNALVHAGNVKDALTMVGDDVRQHTGDIGTQIRLLGLQQQMLSAKSLEAYRQAVLHLRELGIDISGQRLGLANKEFSFKQMMKAPDEKMQAVLEDNGFKWVPDPNTPGYGWAVPKDSPFGGKGQKPTGAGTPPPDHTVTPPPPPDQTKPDASSGGLPASGKTAGGVPFRVVTPNTPNTAPGATGTGGTPDPNEAGISKQEQLRRKQLREKREEQPIPQDTQKQVTGIDESLRLLDEAEKLATDPDVKPWIGPGMGRLSGALYGLGVGVKEKVNRYNQIINYLNVQGTGPLLHGSRNPEIWKQIQEHIPKMKDAPDLALDKIRGARTIYQQNREIELGHSNVSRGQAGGGAVP